MVKAQAGVNHQLRAPAPRRVAIGRLGAAQLLLTVQPSAAAGRDPGPGPGRPHRRCGCVSSGGSIGRNRFEMRSPDSMPPRSLRVIRVAWIGSGLPRASARTNMGRDPGASESSESLGPGRPCPQAAGLGRN